MSRGCIEDVVFNIGAGDAYQETDASSILQKKSLGYLMLEIQFTFEDFFSHQSNLQSMLVH